MSARRPHLVILGAGRAAGQPYGVQRVTLERRVLDWQLDAFDALDPEVDFVGGYEIDQVIRNFPQMTYHYNADWRETGPVVSLDVALQGSPEIADGASDLFVLYSDVLLRPSLVAQMAAAPSGVCLAALDREREAGATELHQERLAIGGEEGEFVGLLRIPRTEVPAFAALTHAAADELRTGRLSLLVGRAIERGAPWRATEASGLWAHAEYGRSVARFVLGTKAATLERLKGRLAQSDVLPLHYFRRRDWEVRPQEILAETLQALGTVGPLIVRSSAIDEDGFASSNAGSFHSEAGVAPEREPLRAAVGRVFASYASANPEDEVLVQPQLTDVEAAGVVFTRCLGSGAPYRVVSFTEGAQTDAITAGNDSDGVVLYCARGADATQGTALPEVGRAVVAAAEEIEACVCHDALDIEFALTSAKRVITLQVRPLMVEDGAQNRAYDSDVDDVLRGVERALHELAPPPSGQFGDAAVWSVMADWNPAEIIGLRPGPLALDLYRHIITDDIWARQRGEAGYRDLGRFPLVRGFGGQAYVDVRASINSFIPAAAAEPVAARMVDHGLARLRQAPDLHDKVEFEIVPTCIDFDPARWRTTYVASGLLSKAECADLEDALRAVTRAIVARTPREAAKAAALDAAWREAEPQGAAFGEWLRQTLDRCKDQGALPFAHLARAGFVAASLLRSAATRGILAPDRCSELVSSITTVAGTMAQDAWKVKTGAWDRQTFIDRYGHLRPGTYDIATPSYRSRPADYIDPIIDVARPCEEHAFAWSAAERRSLDLALRDIDAALTPDAMLAFVREAIVGREYAKFVFTRLLSAALDRISAFAERAGISPEEAECLPLGHLLDGSIDVWGRSGAVRMLREAAQARLRQGQLARLVTLPPVIVRPEEVRAFRVPASQPSFIARGAARGAIRVLKAGMTARREEVEGRIVAILNADPGFDYLFALGIRGLITAFGGPNSHMAIRASEFGLPSVIGIGEHAFAQLSEGARGEIDCGKRRWLQHKADSCAS